MPQSMREAIRGSAETQNGPDGAPRRILGHAHTRQLAIAYGGTARQVELAALEDGIIPERYLRNMQTYGIAEQIRLLKARAAVVGLGGLGGTVAEILARAGVGELVLVDGDCFAAHNLNRQLLCREDQLGKGKAAAALQRVAAINSAVQATVHDTFLTAENGPLILEGSQVAIDCLDNIQARFTLEQAARRVGIPLVSAAVAGLTGHVTTIFPEDAGLERIHGPRHTLQNSTGAEVVLGNLPPTVVMAAAMECAEALTVLTGRTATLLRNKLWVMDLTDGTFEVLSLG